MHDIRFLLKALYPVELGYPGALPGDRVSFSAPDAGSFTERILRRSGGVHQGGVQMGTRLRGPTRETEVDQVMERSAVTVGTVADWVLCHASSPPHRILEEVSLPPARHHGAVRTFPMNVQAEPDVEAGSWALVGLTVQFPYQPVRLIVHPRSEVFHIDWCTIGTRHQLPVGGLPAFMTNRSKASARFSAVLFGHTIVVDHVAVGVGTRAEGAIEDPSRLLGIPSAPAKTPEPTVTRCGCDEHDLEGEDPYRAHRLWEVEQFKDLVRIPPAVVIEPKIRVGDLVLPQIQYPSESEGREMGALDYLRRPGA